MTEKIGLIKNPLTIIAIFAGIAEVSGTIVLPFVAAQNQQLFIWFLISFPSILVLAFFTTLNFNNKVLYAPSDYKDEGNYLISNRYSAVTQSEIIIKEPIDLAFKTLSDRIEELYNQFNYTKEFGNNDVSATVNSINKEVKKMYSFRIISEMKNVDLFVKRMKSLNYDFTKYTSKYEMVSDNPSVENRAIWLGEDIPLDIAKEVIREARMFYPFINFIYLNERENSPSETTSEIFIGGSTKAAVSDLGVLPLDVIGFEQINKSNSLVELHSILHSYNRAKGL